MTNKNTKKSVLFLLLTFILAIAGLTLSLILHWQTDPSFMPWKNYVSDLSIGPNGSSIVFIIMMLGMAFLLAPFLIYFTKELAMEHPPGDGALHPSLGFI